MAFGPLVWYCRPVSNGVWAKAVQNAFGAYTPCADSMVVFISYVALLGLCLYRIWRIMKDLTVQRFQLKSKYYNYMLGLFATYCTAEPLFRLVMGISVVNLDAETTLAPYEVGFLYILIYVSIVLIHAKFAQGKCNIHLCISGSLVIFIRYAELYTNPSISIVRL